MPATQSHGFTWEHAIRSSVYLLNAVAESYTAKHDIPAAMNRFDKALNVSIKTTGASTVDMGDAIRIYENTDPVLLTVIRYIQADDKKRIVTITEIRMPPREILFGSVTREQIFELDRMVKAVPKGRAPTLEEKAPIYAKVKEMRVGALIFNPKMDSKSQRRLQCSWPKFETFCAENPRFLVSRSTNGILRGEQIPLEIESARRG
jgi:hypothetical protein